MRLIDADALKEDLTRFYDNEVTARKLIDEQPTIQPSEPKRGYWKYNAKIGTFKVWTCDQCGWNSEAEFNYCPNCGAKMEGEQDG